MKSIMLNTVHSAPGRKGKEYKHPIIQIHVCLFLNKMDVSFSKQTQQLTTLYFKNMD